MTIDKRTVFAALAVPLGAFVALTLTFVAYAAFLGAVDLALPGAVERDRARGLELVVFALGVSLAARAVLRSHLPAVVRAIALSVPLGTVYAAIGILLYRWPAFVLAAGVAVFAAVLTRLRRTEQPSALTYALVVVSAAMLAMTLTDTDI